MIGKPRRIRITASKRFKVKSKPKKRKKGAPPSISKLIKACDKEFSIQVRNKIPDMPAFSMFVAKTDIPSDWNACFTCFKWFPKEKLHCGHFLSRYYKAARWNFDNARPQCMMCNMWKRGDPIVFRRNLVSEIGEVRVLAVEKLRDAPIKLTREFLTQKLAELKMEAELAQPHVGI